MKYGALLDSFRGLRALVVGDLMLDEYIFGRATRISQEAPVMVVRQSSTKSVPGGAANVASNMVALGARPIVIGVVGDDEPGRRLAASLGEFGIDGGRLVKDPSRPTTRKTRVLANHSHQVLRIDHEDDSPSSVEVEQAVLTQAIAAMNEVDVVLISDYLKGAITGPIIEAIVARGREISVPVVANPKPKSLRHYVGATLVSLNRYEGGAAIGKPEGLTDAEATSTAEALRDRLGVENMLVTLGASGMAAAGASSFFVPSVRVEVYDEAGAGDTVIATVALSIGAKRFGPTALGLATETAAAVVSKVGVATPSEVDLRRIAEIDSGHEV